MVDRYRLERANQPCAWRTRAYRLSLRLLFGLRIRVSDCACKLLQRPLSGRRGQVRRRVLSAELLVEIGARRRRMVGAREPHHRGRLVAHQGRTLVSCSARGA